MCVFVAKDCGHLYVLLSGLQLTLCCKLTNKMVNGLQSAACNWQWLGSNKKNLANAMVAVRSALLVLMSKWFHLEEAFIYVFMWEN